VITGITPEMKIWNEETFGPVLPVIPYDTPEEAVRMANSTPYGLSASVFTKDMAEANWFADRIEAGSVNINDCLVTFAVPSLPFGGVKESGVGTYHGEHGIRGFCRIKSVTEFRGGYSKEFFYYPVAEGIQEVLEAMLILRFSRNVRDKLRAVPKAARLAADLLKGMHRKRGRNRASR
jgi:delta 1-pyrroline-5-carboxylate dehydrogenase